MTPSFPAILPAIEGREPLDAKRSEELYRRLVLPVLKEMWESEPLSL